MKLIQISLQISERFFSYLEFTADDKWRIESEDYLGIYFYEEEKYNEIVLQENEEAYELDEELDEIDDNPYVKWKKKIFAFRFLNASRWLLANQSALQKCFELGFKPFIYIRVFSSEDEFIELPVKFISACGEVGLSFRVAFNC